ncbi:MAG TPA: PrsW family glutamic-type intramembrane protease, partial [Polyangiaceae bacterium]|nr:PrsW family glutamic-type intramembrane protease [Polyangiaceae bacterium]
MLLGPWILGGFLAVLPLAVHGWVLWRSTYLRMHLGLWIAALGTAAALYVPVGLLEHYLQGWADIDPFAGTGGQITLLLYGFFVVAPLEMATVSLAVLPFWRIRRLRMHAGLSRKLETKEGVTFAVSAALGFVTMRNLAFLWWNGSGWLSPVRALLGLATFVLLCALWGYVLGRNAQRGMGGRRFSSA